MPRDRFRSILRYIHVADNSTAPQRDDPTYDKLWKIHPLLDFLSERCLKLYSPHHQVSIDESMIGTKCRLSFIQYMPKKPVKWGIKVWVCADSVTGYICTFDIYCGANSSEQPHPKGLAYGVVMKLLQPSLNKGYTLYVDNFYASPVLLKDLLVLKTLCTGTLRLNRKEFPEILKPQAGQATATRGTCSFAHHDEITVVRWRDNKDVYAISTVSSDSLTVAKCRVGTSTVDIPCPYMIHDYNTFMGGVDLADQVMCYYAVGRKSMKWWRRVFWRMLDHVITNAYVIYSANTATSYFEKRKTRLQFRLDLAQSLTTPAIAMRRGPGRNPSEALPHLTGKHFLYRSGVRKHCVVCAYKKVAGRSKR